MRVAGAVLAGGRSRRMGSTKALIEIEGRAMADRVMDALRSCGADPVVVYGGDPHELRSLDAEVIIDEFPQTGPVGGVLGALHHFAAHTGPQIDAVLIVACDLAFVTAHSFHVLIDAASHDLDSAKAGDSVRPAVWVGTTDRVEPMCALWSLAAIATIEEAFTAGERALHQAIEGCVAREVPLDPHDLVNINRPSDLPPHRGG